MPRRSERDSRFQEAYEKVMADLPTHETTDRLTSFLYVLMRDHLPPGVVTEVAIDAYVGEGGSHILSNSYLAKYAEYLSRKLQAPLEEEEKSVSTETHYTGDKLVSEAPDAFRRRTKKWEKT